MKNMVPTDIVFRPRKESNDACSKCPNGFKETSYRSAFESVLERVIDDVSSFNAEEQPQSKKHGESLVSLYRIYGHCIAVQHGANLSLSTLSTVASNLCHHFTDQAENYNANISVKPEQTWLIVWTTMPSGAHLGHNSNEEYCYPELKTNIPVKTVYIYHDFKFTEVTLFTANQAPVTMNIFALHKEEDEPPNKKLRTSLTEHIAIANTVRVLVTPQHNPPKYLKVNKQGTFVELVESIRIIFLVQAVTNLKCNNLVSIDCDEDVAQLQENDSLTFQ
jgi:hypothetical protein